jgi:hypothetical protein
MESPALFGEQGFPVMAGFEEDKKLTLRLLRELLAEGTSRLINFQLDLVLISVCGLVLVLILVLVLVLVLILALVLVLILVLVLTSLSNTANFKTNQLLTGEDPADLTG